MFLSRKRGFFKGRKGFLIEPLFWLMDLILLVIVLYLTTKYIDDIAEKTTFEKNFLARDLALLTDTVYTPSGNLWMDYPNTTLWFSFSFGDNLVKVFEGKIPPVRIRARYPYIEDKDLRLQKMITPIKDIEEKKPITEHIPLIKNFYSYQPELKQGTFVNLRFLRSGDSIDVDEQKEIAPDLRKLKCSLFGRKPDFPQGERNYYTSWSTVSIEEALMEERPGIHNITILFRYGNNSDKTINNIKAYIPINQVNLAESKYLGCLILNELIANKELKSAIQDENLVDFTGLSVVPIDVGLARADRYTLVLEIGNLQIEQDKDILAKEQILNRAIKTSIENAIGN